MLVTGAAGGVGLATVQVAKALGAVVLAAVSTPDKAAAAKAAGADYVIDTGVADLREKLREQVFAAVGSAASTWSSKTSAATCSTRACARSRGAGALIIVGFAGGRVPEIKAGHLLVKNIAAIGLQFSDYRDREPEKCRLVRQQLFDLYSAGKLKPYVMATFPLERYAEALALVKGRKVIGKAVLTTA